MDLWVLASIGTTSPEITADCSSSPWLMSVLSLCSLHWHHVARSAEESRDSAQNAGVHDPGTAISPQFGEFVGKKNVRLDGGIGGVQVEQFIVRSRTVCCDKVAVLNAIPYGQICLSFVVLA